MANWEDKTKLEEQTLGFFLKGMRVLWELFGKETRLMLMLLVFIGFMSALSHAFSLIMKLLFDELPNLEILGRFNNYALGLIIALVAVKLLAIFFKRLAI